MKRLLVVLLALGACTSSDPRPLAAPTPAPSPPACPNQVAVVSDESLRTGERATGDVDGDGSEEEVSVYFDPSGEPGCQAFVVAGSLAGPLESWSADFGLPMPTLNSLRQIDEEPGEEVVVNMGIGASTQFVGIVAAAGGGLVQVTSDGAPDQPADGLFGFGGSVGHLEAVDCASGGTVVSSVAVPRGKRYRVDRRFLTFDGPRLVERRTDVVFTPAEDVDELPEYRGSPFGSCSG